LRAAEVERQKNAKLELKRKAEAEAAEAERKKKAAEEAAKVEEKRRAAEAARLNSLGIDAQIKEYRKKLSEEGIKASDKFEWEGILARLVEQKKIADKKKADEEAALKEQERLRKKKAAEAEAEKKR